MKADTQRICLWSGPRNISTALMYSFAQRNDTTVYDEPLYAHYLRNTNAKEYHPGSAEILATMENDGEKVVKMMMGDHSTSIAFFKHMTHHLVSLDFSFFRDVDHVILTRDPQEMLPSYAKAVEKPTLIDVGYKQHIDLIDKLNRIGKSYIVVDSRTILMNPKKRLLQLCDLLKIPFDEAMLYWDRGARKEDGCWARYWYQNVHNSTGFQPYQSKSDVFPDDLRPLLDECKPYYQKLLEHAI